MSKGKAESLGRSSGKISAATAASRVSGLVRETVFAYLLGSGLAADAFFAATRIPNLLRDLFAEGALGAAFVPVVSEKEPIITMLWQVSEPISIVTTRPLETSF